MPTSSPLPSSPAYAPLAGRAVLAIGGPDRVAFLNGLVANDVRRVTAEQAIYTGMLTPQGKYLYDFFIASDGERLLLEGEADRVPDLCRRLGLYKLRSHVSLDATPLTVFALMGERSAVPLGLAPEVGRTAAFADGLAFIDPRLPALGARALLPGASAEVSLAAAGFSPTGADAYDALRLSLGVPDGSRDMLIERSLPLECGFDELNGVDWNKGCYMGQELTARMKYRKLVKKRLLPVHVDGPLPAPGTLVHVGDREAGEIRSGHNGAALAMLRIEFLHDGGAGVEFRAGDARIVPTVPSWLRLSTSA